MPQAGGTRRRTRRSLNVCAVAAAMLLAPFGGVSSASADLAAVAAPLVGVSGTLSALPLPYAGNAAQVITVVAPSPTSTSATVTAWARWGRRWKAIVGPVSAKVGADGIGSASEYVSRTPAGTYRLTQAFGRQPDPGTRLPYFRSTVRDWWDENPASPTYNTHVRQWASPGGHSENLYRAGPVYDYVVNIDYNTARVPGAGSGIFLHITNGSPTAGCVAIGRNALVRIMRWLRPAAAPVIVIGTR